MSRKILALALTAWVAGLGVPAHAVTVIDFESLSDSDAVTTQFPGLTFSNAIALSAGISLNELEFPPRSGVNVVSDDGGPLTIDFGPLVSAVGGYFTYLVPLTLTAFDSSFNVVGMATSAFVSNLALSGDFGSLPNEFLGVAFAGGISRLTIEGDPFGGSFTLDDLKVSPVPEPATLLLLAGGLAGLARLRKPRGPV